MKILKKYSNFINEELKILKGPTDDETEKAFMELPPEQMLMMGVEYNLINVVKHAIEKENAYIDHADHNGETALILASKKGYYDIVKLLIEKGANVNKSDKDHLTPLLTATRENNFNAVKCLVEHGADITIKHNRGMDALRIAEINHKPQFGDDRDYSEIIEYLKNKLVHK